MDYIINEKDISSTIQDFEALCEYIAANKVALTATRALGKKACFALNSRMAYPAPNVKETDQMKEYPSIALYLSIALEAGLIEPGRGKKSAAIMTDAYRAFGKMNGYSKYLFLFLAWMRYTDIEALYAREALGRLLDAYQFDAFFEHVGKMPQPAVISTKAFGDADIFDDEQIVQTFMEGCLTILCHLRCFGIIGYDDEDVENPGTYRAFIRKVNITEPGIALSSACYTRRFTWVNMLERERVKNNDDDIEIFENDFDRNRPGSPGFLKPFLARFPEKEIDEEAISALLFPRTEASAYRMIYEFQVSLDSDCYRVIECGGDDTFDDLHLAIQNAFLFDNDHLYAFFMDGKRWSRRSIHSPYSEEPPFADEVCIGEARMRPKQKILYLFDFGDQWVFEVKLLSIREGEPDFNRPFVTKSVGEAPEQYPSEDYWDDDWDDEDWDEDENEDGDDDV
jgi:hypothetical protein